MRFYIYVYVYICVLCLPSKDFKHGVKRKHKHKCKCNFSGFTPCDIMNLITAKICVAFQHGNLKNCVSLLRSKNTGVTWGQRKNKRLVVEVLVFLLNWAFQTLKSMG